MEGCGIVVTGGPADPLTGREPGESVFVEAVTVEVRLICGVGMAMRTGCSTGDVAWALDDRDKLLVFSATDVPGVDGPAWFCCANETADSFKPILDKAT
jgi:hypothetical protein